MRVLVTGASGFTGTYLLEFLSSREEVEVTGLGRKSHIPSFSARNLSWVEGDILDPDNTYDFVSATKPNTIIHLAGLNRGSLAELLETNVIGTKNILDATLKVNPDCRVLVISSSAVYGYAGNNAIGEDISLHPFTEYGISKAAQDNLCVMYHKTRNVLVAIARPFNLVGPYQPSFFVCGNIVRQVIEIEQGKRTFINLYEISSYRDFVDVRDVINGYWSLLSHPDFEHVCCGNAFNIGSGKPSAISEVIGYLEEITGDLYDVQLPEKSPHIPVPTQKSDNSRIHAITGWSPKISIKKSLHDMLTAARKEAYCS